MRRATPLLLGAGLALLLWAAAPALSVGPFVPRAADFELAVPDAHGTAAAASAVRTLRAPKRFDLLGLRWRPAAGASAEVRVRRDGGQWSRWVALDADSKGRTDPVWAGESDQLQLRTHGRVRGLRIHFVNSTGTATRADRVRTALRRGIHAAVAAVAAPFAKAAEPQPDIVTRDAWGADQCKPRTAPSYGEVDMAFVHHTVSANDYTAADSAAIVLAICRYHRNSNGWNDVGYNFLVDRFGTIFEGREGGVQAAVIGAQAQGWNSHSTGVAVIGTQETEPATEETIQSLAKLLAWKLPFHGIPVAGKVTVPSGGGADNRYPYNTPVTFERISGHRDGDRTSCPGSALYGQLPRLRSLVAARVTPAPSLTLTAARTELAYPGTAELSGRLALTDGSAVAGAPVQIQRLGGTGFKTVKTVTTGADGSWSVSIPTSLSRVFRALAPGDDTRQAGRSTQIAVSVIPSLTARVASKRVPVGRSAVITGTLRPHKPSVSLVVAKQTAAGGAFARVRTIRVRVSGARFRVTQLLRRPGLYRLQIRFAGDGSNGAVRSVPLTVRAVRG
jgi:hypothetical protein